jgi:inorganic phosphate transporter, PiT family
VLLTSWIFVRVAPRTVDGTLRCNSSRRRYKVSAVRWNVATNIVMAWIVTLPASALVAAIFYWLSGLGS